MRPPARPKEGVVSWNVNTSCNYRCSYCTQRFKDDRTRWSRDTPRFLEAFSRLPGRWEVKISGGEPFVHPTLFGIVSGLSGLGFRVSIVTNFSVHKNRLERYLEAAKGRTGVFSASLHLEHVEDIDAFIEKALWFAARLQRSRDPDLPAPHLSVTLVAVKENLAKIGDLSQRFGAAGLTFKLQPEKQDRHIVSYAPEEEALLLAHGGHNLTGRVVHRFLGRPCWAGARYLILDDRGEAYRCYPARAKKLQRLGDFLSPDFQLKEDPSPCIYEACYCTVPISRGMMSGIEAHGGDE